MFIHCIVLPVRTVFISTTTPFTVMKESQRVHHNVDMVPERPASPQLNLICHPPSTPSRGNEDNELVEINAAELLPALVFLDCSGNRIGDLPDFVETLKSPPRLNEVIATGNPVL